MLVTGSPEEGEYLCILSLSQYGGGASAKNPPFWLRMEGLVEKTPMLPNSSAELVLTWKEMFQPFGIVMMMSV